MIKKLTLDFEEDNDVRLVGINSPIKDYRLIFFLNRVLKLNFKRLASIEFKRKSVLNLFSIYNMEFDHDLYKFHLVSNRGSNFFLIPEYKNIDFLFFVEGDVPDDLLDEIILKMRGIDKIGLVSELKTDLIKSIDYLLESLELHICNTN